MAADSLGGGDTVATGTESDPIRRGESSTAGVHAGAEPDKGTATGTVGRSRETSSPYSTGGGGVTLERRVGALYLARLLTDSTSPELGDGRDVRTVAFQQAQHTPVDDLVIEAGRTDETEPSLELAIGVRARPNLIRSNEDSQKLVAEFLRALLGAPDDGREHRLGLAVAGRQDHAEQLATLTGLARNQVNAGSFFSLIGSQRYRQQLSGRLDQFKGLVEAALPKVGVSETDEQAIRQYTWDLLQSLWVLMAAVEEPDTSDWAAAQNDLVAVARGRDLAGAGHLLDRLEALVGQYGPAAATVDRPMLRREVYSLLENPRRRNRDGWELLDHLQRQARGTVRDEIGQDGGQGPLRLDRSGEAAAVLVAAEGSEVLIVDGESGAGKSALVLGAARVAVEESAGEMEVVLLNLRHLPESSFDLVSRLGCQVEALLADFSAPRRFLVVDGADAAMELRRDLFLYLVDAARAAGVQLIAITSSESRKLLHDLVASRVGAEVVAGHTVPGLTDQQLEVVANAFPVLARLATNERSREVLRRLVVVDLLVRSEAAGIPLSDADAMRQVWSGLVRNHGRRDRGIPDAREQVMLRLATRELSRDSARELVTELDAGAVAGLRQDGLLRTSEENPWQVLPEFAHDEIRRYAVARVLLADGSPARALLDVDAPRWALSAARLACQGVLDRPDSAEAPLHGRFTRLQAEFDRLVEAGHGLRWADLPAEALLTLGDPRPALRDAWPDLRPGDGLHRFLRLMGQRHRDSAHLFDPVVVEPVIELLLEDQAPTRISEEVTTALREWLLALVARDAPAENPLRIRLRHHLIAMCEEGERQLREREAEAAAARAARQPSPAEQERERLVRESDRISAAILGTRRRRQRPRLPRELIDDDTLELLALLGPDLGDAGEQLLRRVAQDSPQHLTPALEELLTGKALATYGHGLLADLVEAYYIDEDGDTGGFLEDGVRRHRWRGGVTPMTAWYRGPFAALYQTDFRRGVAVVNRLLNHAARVRISDGLGIGDPWAQISDQQIEEMSITTCITGEERTYAGDDRVWRWYRATGGGPYPCMSALQALERFSEQLVAAGVPLDRLIAILLEGCENLAMPGLIVGLLVRHLESAGRLLDPYLAEPFAWRLEFTRVVSESSSLAPSSDGLANPERRRWSLREAGMWLTLHADPQRAEELKAVGDQLVAAAVELERGDAAEEEGASAPSDDQSQEVTFTATVQGWASALDRSRYRARAEGDVIYVEYIPPEEVASALEPGSEDLQRGQEAMRLQWRYFAGGSVAREKPDPPTAEELAADLASAMGLFKDPPELSAVGVWDMAAAVAAAALEGRLVRGLELPQDAMDFAVNTVLAVAEGVNPPNEFEFDGSFFEQGADRLAARAQPLLLLPDAADLQERAGAHGQSGEDRVLGAGLRLAQGIADETRLHLARGLDAVWREPCTGEGKCHHKIALKWVIESMRDSVFGGWDQEAQRRRIERLPDPVVEELARTADDAILVSRLDAPIRAAGAAAVADICVSDRALELLLTLLVAHRRGLLGHDRYYDERGTHAMVVARALLGLAAHGNDALLEEHVAAYADHSTALGSLLEALTAAGEESERAAEAARRVWPAIMTHVLELNGSGHRPFADSYFGRAALAALVPGPTHEIQFLYREVERDPIAWPDLPAWEKQIDAWLPLAAGDSQCIDAMIAALRRLPEQDQVVFGLPRVATLVHGDVEGVARRCFLLSGWLTDTRSMAETAGMLPDWQALVDSLVVAGNTTLAPYSD